MAFLCDIFTILYMVVYVFILLFPRVFDHFEKLQILKSMFLVYLI